MKEINFAVVKKLSDIVETATRTHSKEVRLSTADAVSLLAVITNLSVKAIEKPQVIHKPQVTDGGSFK
jgi:hypothetical protein